MTYVDRLPTCLTSTQLLNIVTSLLKQLLACKLGGTTYCIHHAKTLDLIIRDFTSSRLTGHFLIGNLRDYYLYHNQPSTFSTRRPPCRHTHSLPKVRHFWESLNTDETIMISTTKDTFLRCGNCLLKLSTT